MINNDPWSDIKIHILWLSSVEVVSYQPHTYTISDAFDGGLEEVKAGKRSSNLAVAWFFAQALQPHRCLYTLGKMTAQTPSILDTTLVGDDDEHVHMKRAPL